ncbi:MAG TPA: serine protease [Syntrophales bacterium]|nr:serine protease [Syntrophales bacterium]
MVAVLRFRTIRHQTMKKGKVRPAKYECNWGSGFVVVADRYVVTAFHVLTDGHSRNPQDKFVVFIVPGNGDPAFHFPVINFPVERSDLDLAILEIGPCATQGMHLPALPVSFGTQLDGARVLTVGFPAPEIVSINIDDQGNYIGGQLFLKSHANEGIVSAQYRLGTLNVYEFNIGWHHGESGGPIVKLDEQVSVFTVMQQYRSIQSPNGIFAGPHRGCALSALQHDLIKLGATIV